VKRHYAATAVAGLGRGALTWASMFSGGELAGIGARAAGLRHLWGVEIDPDIAAVAHANGFDGVLVADVLTLDPRTLGAPFALHASPVCTRASQANQSAELNEDGTKEAPLDLAMAGKVAEFIDVLKPRVFTLENVYAYRKFKSFKRITDALDRGGYFWDYDNLNSADYGVPQTRHRLVLRALHGALLPNLPPPEPWIGWYAAIEDLLPTLPVSKFAPWQLARLPEFLQSTLVDSAGYPGGDGVTVPVMRDEHEPSNVIVANFSQRPMRAFIVSNSKTEYSDGVRPGDDPALSVTGQQVGRLRAFIMPTVNADGTAHERNGNEPTHTVQATAHKQMPRAFIVDGKNARPIIGDPTRRASDQPMFTVVQSSAKGMARAWLSAGRVVSMTPRALARFQSVPDSYVLPAKASLACKVIGNGWPSLMAQKIIAALAHAAPGRE
jgi:site-specific DNA-cytosine methylase